MTIMVPVKGLKNLSVWDYKKLNSFLSTISPPFGKKTISFGKNKSGLVYQYTWYTGTGILVCVV